jgi:hypothetical protein
VLLIGQWAPIVGTFLAVIGSLYLLKVMQDQDTSLSTSTTHCNCSHDHHVGELQQTRGAPHSDDRTPSSLDAQSIHSNHFGQPVRPPMSSPEMHEIRSLRSMTTIDTAHMRTSSGDMAFTTSRPPLQTQSQTSDAGGRRKVAQTLQTVGNAFLGTAPHDWYDDSEFKQGTASDFPEIPGEKQRNSALTQIKKQYNPRRDTEGNATPMLRAQRSRAESFNGSVFSGLDIDDRGSFDIPDPSSSSGAGRVPQRQNTLEVPGATHLNPARNDLGPSSSRPPESPPPTVLRDPDKREEEENG